VNETVAALEGFHFNEAASTAYQFVWGELCDWYIELSKEALSGGEPGRDGSPAEGSPEQRERKRSAQAVLTHCLETSLRLLHPMMPFITEELWQTLGSQVGTAGPDSILLAAYPATGPVDEAAERSFGPVIGIVDAIRSIRGEMNIPFKTALPGVQVGALAPEAVDTVREETSRIERLANAPGLRIGTGATRKVPQSAVAVGAGFEVRVPLAGAVDMAAETARIDKELSRLDQDLAGLERKLQNPSFVAKAPAEVVEKDRSRIAELKQKRAKLLAHKDLLAWTEGSEAAPAGTAAPPIAPAGEGDSEGAAAPPAPKARPETPAGAAAPRQRTRRKRAARKAAPTKRAAGKKPARKKPARRKAARRASPARSRTARRPARPRRRR
jgi:valyl-tRNA synthetase